MWPILPGDGLTSGRSPSVVTFPDGSTLVLDHASKAKIDFLNGRPVFQLISGSVRYTLKSLSAVELMAGAKTEVPKALTGTLKVVSRKTVVVAVVGGAADVAAKTYGIDKAVSGDPSVSGK
jgi:ferric-dicitrate binding protein FerR (iron transport regulator)